MHYSAIRFNQITARREIFETRSLYIALQSRSIHSSSCRRQLASPRPDQHYVQVSTAFVQRTVGHVVQCPDRFLSLGAATTPRRQAHSKDSVGCTNLQRRRESGNAGHCMTSSTAVSCYLSNASSHLLVPCPWVNVDYKESGEFLESRSRESNHSSRRLVCLLGSNGRAEICRTCTHSSVSGTPPASPSRGTPSIGCMYDVRASPKQ